MKWGRNHAELHTRLQTSAHPPLPHMQSLTCMHACMHTHTRARTRTHTHTHSCAHIQTCAHKPHTRTHARTNHTHMHSTHTHVHFLSGANQHGREPPNTILINYVMSISSHPCAHVLSAMWSGRSQEKATAVLRSTLGCRKARCTAGEGNPGGTTQFLLTARCGRDGRGEGARRI